jgi:hypothetical protein
MDLVIFAMLGVHGGERPEFQPGRDGGARRDIRIAPAS